jgi:hypothetical protein
MSNKQDFQSRSGTLPEVPWVMGDPSASYKWQVSVAGKGKKKDKDQRRRPKRLENVVLKIRLNVKKRRVPGSSFKRLFGSKIEEDFNPLAVLEVLLRALHHAKFRSIISISGDNEILYESKNEKSIKEIVAFLKDEEFEGNLLRIVEISARHRTDLTAEIEINKVHFRKKAPIKISFKGKISKENLERLMGYINKHLSVKAMSY